MICDDQLMHSSLHAFTATLKIAQVRRLERVTIARNTGIDCVGKTASRAFYTPLTVKTQN